MANSEDALACIAFLLLFCSRIGICVFGFVVLNASFFLRASVHVQGVAVAKGATPRKSKTEDELKGREGDNLDAAANGNICKFSKQVIFETMSLLR